jgi:hypothetical protein
MGCRCKCFPAKRVRADAVPSGGRGILRSRREPSISSPCPSLGDSLVAIFTGASQLPFATGELDTPSNDSIRSANLVLADEGVGMQFDGLNRREVLRALASGLFASLSLDGLGAVGMVTNAHSEDDYLKDVIFPLYGYAERTSCLQRCVTHMGHQGETWQEFQTPFFNNGDVDDLLIATDYQISDWAEAIWDRINVRVNRIVDVQNWEAQRPAFKDFVGQLFRGRKGRPAFIWLTFAKPPASFGMRRHHVKADYGPRSCETLRGGRAAYHLPYGQDGEQMQVAIRKKTGQSGVILEYAGTCGKSDLRPVIHSRVKTGIDKYGTKGIYGRHCELDMAAPDDIDGLRSSSGDSSIGREFLQREPVVHQNFLCLTMGLLDGPAQSSVLSACTWTLHPVEAVTFGINQQVAYFERFLIQYPSLAELMRQYLRPPC